MSSTVRALNLAPRSPVAPRLLAGRETSAAEDTLLNMLRLAALVCRAKRRPDVFKACAELQNDRKRPLAHSIDVLAHCLPLAADRSFVFYRPGTKTLSYDEIWLRSLAVSLAQEDHLSVRFLLRSRVKEEHHRNIKFLVGRVFGAKAIT